MARSTIDGDTAHSTTSPPPRRSGQSLGLGADGTSSPLGLILKITALGV
jgi:hypothetical protein